MAQGRTSVLIPQLVVSGGQKAAYDLAALGAEVLRVMPGPAGSSLLMHAQRSRREST